MSFTPTYKIETEKDKIICDTCSNLSNSYNNATNQNLSFELDKDYIIFERSIYPDLLKLLWLFNLHTIDMLCKQDDETILSYYILGMLTSRLIEVRFLDKNDDDKKIYVRTLYNLLSNFNFDFLSHKENIINSNKKLDNLKNQFEIFYKSWL
jgi:hypothetical protein